MSFKNMYFSTFLLVLYITFDSWYACKSINLLTRHTYIKILNETVFLHEYIQTNY